MDYGKSNKVSRGVTLTKQDQRQERVLPIHYILILPDVSHEIPFKACDEHLTQTTNYP